MKKFGIVEGPPLKHPVKSGLGEFYYNSAEHYGDNIFQTDARTDQSETYLSVKLRSTRLALQLEDRGIRNKDIIVICCELSLDTVILMFGCLFLGSKIANLDRNSSVEYTTKLLALVDPTMVFVDSDRVSLIETSLNRANSKADIVVVGNSVKYYTIRDYLKPHKDEKLFRPFRARIQDIALIFFSKDKGQTLLKAVGHTHYSFLSAVHSAFQSGYTCEIILCSAPFCQFTSFLLMSILFLSGGRRIFCRNQTPEDTFRIIQTYKVTDLYLTPESSVELTSSDKSSNFDTSSLLNILLTGSTTTSDQIRTIDSLFKNCIVLYAYGLKEAGIITMFNSRRDNNLIFQKVGSTGKVLAGVAVKVVDSQTNMPAEANQKGEIYIKSPSLTRGYYNEDSSGLFDGSGFLKTGDVGFYDEDHCFRIVDSKNK